MRFLLGIDDTDNLESRGTGYRSRQLGEVIEKMNLGRIKGIVRHQLFVHESIPFTSHNSSASIEVESDFEKELIQACREFLLEFSADGSDAGLCVAKLDFVNEEVKNWGKRAKVEIITKHEAHQIAENQHIFLEGLTGKKIGVIGALAAVGLRAAGNDGRFLMLEGKEIRDIKGVFTKPELQKITSIGNIFEKNTDFQIPENEFIFVDEWMRPILKNGEPILIVEKSDVSDYQWKSANKEFIKRITE